MRTKINIEDNVFVPKHFKMTEEEIRSFLINFNISTKQLPKICSKDPIIKLIGAKVGDIIKIIRKSPTVGEACFYRLVINE